MRIRSKRPPFETLMSMAGLLAWSNPVWVENSFSDFSTISQGEENEIARIFRGGEIIIDRPHPKDLVNVTSAFIQSRQAQVGLGVTIYPDGERQEVYIVIITPKGEQQFTRPYGGPRSTPRAGRSTTA